MEWMSPRNCKWKDDYRASFPHLILRLLIVVALTAVLIIVSYESESSVKIQNLAPRPTCSACSQLPEHRSPQLKVTTHAPELLENATDIIGTAAMHSRAELAYPGNFLRYDADYSGAARRTIELPQDYETQDGGRSSLVSMALVRGPLPAENMHVTDGGPLLLNNAYDATPRDGAATGPADEWGFFVKQGGYFVRSSCGNVLADMVHGAWRPKGENATAADVAAAAQHRREYRRYQNVDAIQRSDGRCGRGLTTDVNPDLMALCEPDGPTPCCHEGRCRNMAAAECRCESGNCFDLRREILAELAYWQPRESTCKMQRFSPRKACTLLRVNGVRLVVMGDSMLRKMYQALMIILRDNALTGSLAVNTPPEITTECQGQAQFTRTICGKMHLASSSRHLPSTDFCQNIKMAASDRHFGVEFVSAQNTSTADVALATARSLLRRKGSLLVLGIGFHDHCNAARVIEQYLTPVVAEVRTHGQGWPKLLWVSVDHPGLLKPLPYRRLQGIERCGPFSQKIARYLARFEVPVLNTVELTSDVSSYDGTHYAHGVNDVKVQILLNYVLELFLKMRRRTQAARVTH